MDVWRYRNKYLARVISTAYCVSPKMRDEPFIFVKERLKPHVQTDANGSFVGVTYEPENGIFKRTCNAVQTDQSKDIVEYADDYLQKKIK
ncbi:MAG: hypothetical protein NC206_03445 [Bacteroides sp.]|nr:hypothetical protein [Roseburia sp.]MCM1346120.1 hypothetical protein [Bacteroides sp.]